MYVFSASVYGEGDFRVGKRVIILLNNKFEPIRAFLCSVDGEVAIIEYASGQYSDRTRRNLAKSLNLVQPGPGAMKERGEKLEGKKVAVTGESG